MRWLGGITKSMDVCLSTLGEIVKDGEGGRAAVHGVAKADMTERPNSYSSKSLAYESHTPTKTDNLMPWCSSCLLR